MQCVRRNAHRESWEKRHAKTGAMRSVSYCSNEIPARVRRQQGDGAILDAAEYMFGWEGYQRATMEAVTREAGTSVGTLYGLFRSKEGLYGQVAQRIGHAVVARIQAVSHARKPENAALDVIRLRLTNHANDRLFFQPFCLPAYLGVQPESARLGCEVNQVHQQYVNLVQTIFERCLARTGQEGAKAAEVATHLEGMITTFMDYWSGQLQWHDFRRVAHQMRSILLYEVELPSERTEAVETPSKAGPRSICVSRYDLERLRGCL